MDTRIQKIYDKIYNTHIWTSIKTTEINLVIDAINLLTQNVSKREIENSLTPRKKKSITKNTLAALKLN